MTNGWVKLHRKILENVELMNDDTAYIVFTKLLLMANSKGQIGQSGRELGETLKIKHSTLYKCLKRLEEYQMIKQSSKHSYTLILICNWSTYQDTGKHFGKQLVNGRETDGKHQTGVARIENKNKESSLAKNEPAATKKGYMLAKQQAMLIKKRTLK